jgi:hypothetical protein
VPILTASLMSKGVLDGKEAEECDYHAAVVLSSGLIELLLLALDTELDKDVPIAVEI